MHSVPEAPPAKTLQLFEADFEQPAENLAADEALLDECDDSAHPGFLRFWESPSHFVVLGYGKHLDEEVFRDQCRDLGVPIFRRCSGGGTVLQGPGCLNYALVLPFAHAPELETITGANRFIMEIIRRAAGSLSASPVSVQGHTDLVLQGRKFSGNAQRRKKRCLLFHGSFLLDFDLGLISRTLRLPGLQPEYRSRRTHADFLANFPADRQRVRQALASAWAAHPEANPALAARVRAAAGKLAAEKYSRTDWNEKL